ALSTRTATRPAWARVVSVRFLARFVTCPLSGRGARAVVGSRYQACPPALVRRHNRCAAGPRERPILVLTARYPRVRPGLASWIKPRKGIGMDTVRRYSLLIDGAWVDTEDRFEIRRDRKS